MSGKDVAAAGVVGLNAVATVQSIDEAADLELKVEQFSADRGGAYGAAAPGSRIARWLGGSAGTTFDGWLLTVCSQIGQIMLTLPNAFAKMGLVLALPLSIFSSVCSLWTMFCLVTLYAERKRRLIKQGLWEGEGGKQGRITQYHDVIGDTLGKHARTLAQTIVILSLLGTSIAQVIACSSDAYYLNGPAGLSKRTLAIIFASLMQLTVLMPTMRHLRIINIIGVIGTTFTTWYIVGEAAAVGPAAKQSLWPLTTQFFYLGLSVANSAFGGHAIALEIMDSLFEPVKYKKTYFHGYLYIFSLTLPHSLAVQVTWPTQALANGNVYGVLPLNDLKRVSIYLMLIHQLIAFLLYCSPLFYMWEKLLGIHEKSIWVRAPARLPVSLLVGLIGIAFPFYGTINSIIGAITSPIIAFALPAAAYSYLYRTKALQDAMPFKPPGFLTKLFGFNGVHAFNLFIIVYYIVNGTGFGIFYSVKQFVTDVKTFHVFPACYQC
jgi:auxin influx carrier (AUX1 LAX family)